MITSVTAGQTGMISKIIYRWISAVLRTILFCAIDAIVIPAKAHNVIALVSFTLLFCYCIIFNHLYSEMVDAIRNTYKVREVQNSLTKDLKITPSDVRKYFSQLPADSIPFVPLQVDPCR